MSVSYDHYIYHTNVILSIFSALLIFHVLTKVLLGDMLYKQ